MGVGAGGAVLNATRETYVKAMPLGSAPNRSLWGGAVKRSRDAAALGEVAHKEGHG